MGNTDGCNYIGGLQELISDCNLPLTYYLVTTYVPHDQIGQPLWAVSLRRDDGTDLSDEVADVTDEHLI